MMNQLRNKAQRMCASTARSLGQRNPVFRCLSSYQDNDAVVVSVSRTAICKVGGSFASLSAPKLASIAIKSAVERSGISPAKIEEAYIGNVISAGIGQAPARQAIVFAGLPVGISCTTVNKVCASGLKASILCSMSITSGYQNACIAGGMESMSNVPYYISGARSGLRMGNKELIDGMLHDGLIDAYNAQHMGLCAEATAEAFKISREEQDAYATMSYERAADTWKRGIYSLEVVPVEITNKKEKKVIDRDEEFTSMDLKKIPTLKPVFKAGGTVTAGNSSKLNDGASAMVMTSGKLCRELGLVPLFKIRGYGDAEIEPKRFCEAPAASVPKALRHAGITAKDVDYHEVNEAFAIVPIVTARVLDLDLERVNVHGGAVALGHPLGSSGTAIIMRLYGTLKDKDATIGCASICNGGGGASALVIERLS